MSWDHFHCLGLVSAAAIGVMVLNLASIKIHYEQVSISLQKHCIFSHVRHWLIAKGIKTNDCFRFYFVLRNVLMPHQTRTDDGSLSRWLTRHSWSWRANSVRNMFGVLRTWTSQRHWLASCRTWRIMVRPLENNMYQLISKVSCDILLFIILLSIFWKLPVIQKEIWRELHSIVPLSPFRWSWKSAITKRWMVGGKLPSPFALF